jgi:hypothetical protein
MQGYFVLVWELCLPEIQFACVHLHNAHIIMIVAAVVVVLVFVSALLFMVLRLRQVGACH